MKVYPLHIGDSKIPYGQFCGGLEGWSGPGAVWRFLRDKSHFVVVPIYAYLIDHPRAGLILVDTGINCDLAHAHNQYYKGLLFHLTLDEDEYLLTHEQELSAHLRRLGHRPEDVQTVVLTHLHEDHLGELRLLPQARVVLSRREWDAKNLGIFLFREWSPSYAGAVKSPELISYSSGPCHKFAASHDLLGDGSIVLLPTPGHAEGHLGVLVQMEGYQLLLSGDVLYTLRHLAVDEVRAITLSKKMQQGLISSMPSIQQLREALPGMVLAPPHDHTAYMSRYLEPFLADGGLSLEERQAIKDTSHACSTGQGSCCRTSCPAMSRQPTRDAWVL